MSLMQKTLNRQGWKQSGKEYKEQKTSHGHGKLSDQKKILRKKDVWYNEASTPTQPFGERTATNQRGNVDEHTRRSSTTSIF
jgi:hypothetical protein